MADKYYRGNILTKKGFKNTKSRQAVICVLEKAEGPISAEELFLRVKDAGISVNLSTVYRTLELMESKGLVEKTILSDSKARYELTGEGHRHLLVCINCRRTVPIEGCPLHKLESDIGMSTKFDITGHKLELYGVCPECKNK